MSLAAVVLAAVFYRELAASLRVLCVPGILVGVFLFVGNELQTIGLKYTTPSKSAFLTGVSVVLVPGIAGFVLEARPQSLDRRGRGSGIRRAYTC